jgi:dTDP-4-dehydrorhamnose reductase
VVGAAPSPRRHPDRGVAVRVLVTGASGQVGLAVQHVCAAAGDEVFAAGRETLDVTDRDAVLGALTTLRPDAVVHCAAWTAVDACEGDPRHAFAANGLAVRWVAEGCRRSGAHLVHLSTDYVFAGSKTEPYREWDPTGPVNVYGASKLAGEQEAVAAGIGATIARTSWVVSEHAPNMLTTILRLLDQPGPLSFVDDQIGHVTFTGDLARTLRRLAVDRRPGIHHVTNQGPMSWFDFARAVATATGHDPDRVAAIATADLVPARPATRPLNSVLENAVLTASGLPLLPDVRESLPSVLEAIRSLG